ncbi:MAG TPA: RdgB/HAM1 family non-canonical purine NTP pyrophosphatase [Candidatus Glassbacteria bacterium]|nr:RdgB/HAM1 family non-canonical purine NTP pyrophosphatase [Candidatus Glassbacteria bacterium]
MKAKQLLVASFNPGKIAEVGQILVGGGVTVIGPESLELKADPPDESGATFRENALLKARYWCDLSGLPTLADDSGLAVDALGGAPGVYSSRFAGANATDRENILLLLDRMKSVPDLDRTASFICWLALCRPGLEPLYFSGNCSGRILQQPAGRSGFGYDPVFYYPPFGKSFAQVSGEDKNRVSHRARALAEFKNWLKNNEL